jgi:methanogenic corrinoid protein MtbC1
MAEFGQSNKSQGRPGNGRAKSQPAGAKRTNGHASLNGNGHAHASLNGNGAQPGSAARLQPAQLLRAIETEIIPRLMMIHRSAEAGSVLPARSDGLVQRESVAEFAASVMLREVPAAFAFIEALRARGVTLEQIYLELLAPTATYLGQLWIEDRCTFTDVTIALWRLQQVLHQFSDEFLCDAEADVCNRSALVLAIPGEQHTLGVNMVAEFLRRAGWEVSGQTPASMDEFLRLVQREWFSVIGLSTSCETRLEFLSQAIPAIRKASLNRAVRVMVGGFAFNGHPDRVRMVGADATAGDSRHAVTEAEKQLASLASLTRQSRHAVIPVN